MENNLIVSSSPHLHSGARTRKIMLDVIIALAPATVMAVVLFGIRALLLILTSVATAVLSEFLFNIITKKNQTVFDLSAVVTGLLLALTLPATTKLWQVVVGAVFAIVVAKCLFGGIGCNFANPAIAARVMMLISFTNDVAGGTSTGFAENPLEAGATPLAVIGKEGAVLPSLTDMLIGNRGGAIGETCAIALLVGFVYLIVRRVITWHIPVSFVGTVFLASLFMEGFSVMTALSLILSGGLLLGAIFMATDYVTSPATPLGKIVFGVGAGLLTFMIRYFATYPEGASFAILIMNILTPYIEKLTARKIFGGNKA